MQNISAMHSLDGKGHLLHQVQCFLQTEHHAAPVSPLVAPRGLPAREVTREVNPVGQLQQDALEQKQPVIIALTDLEQQPEQDDPVASPASLHVWAQGVTHKRGKSGGIRGTEYQRRCQLLWRQVHTGHASPLQLAAEAFWSFCLY